MLIKRTSGCKALHEYVVCDGACAYGSKIRGLSPIQLSSRLMMDIEPYTASGLFQLFGHHDVQNIIELSSVTFVMYVHMPC